MPPPAEKLQQLEHLEKELANALHAAKWINDGDTSSRCQGVGRPHIIKEKERQTLSRLVQQNQCQTVALLTAQCNAGPSTSVSDHTVQQTSHSCASVDQASSSTTPTVDPGTSRLDHG
ncbi:hypothetical protein AVEN_64649-1 [Araneus ventricosus]|uniref:Uncharacterized protein n=1 Tax=Araneus ventricosus TaxID=182803 RepID=A0A4Y2HYT7_ARAVE|nr:hypothetical protein AVEN_64649-1 [Araneus ventricosus]